MRIGLVIETFDPARGGAEHWTYQFAQRLLSLGHEVHVAARQFARRGLGDVHLHALPAGGRLDFAADAERTLRPLELDVVHDMGAGWYGDLFQPHGGSRVATHEANLRLAPAWLRPLKRRFAPLLPRYREFDRLMARQYADRGQVFIALSRMVMRDMLYHHDLPAERIRLVYNGVDVDRFSPVYREQYRAEMRRNLGVSGDTVLLLIAAHNFRLKGVPTLIKAVGQLAAGSGSVHLAIAGGKRFARYQRQAEREGVGPQVTFLGSVEDMRPLYAAADVYVQPTFYDPCSLVVLEAFASGLPVITSQCNGASELMTESVHGYILQDPGDSEELAACLMPLLDERRRTEMGAAARQLALKHTLARNCQEMIAVYTEVAQRRGKAA